MRFLVCKKSIICLFITLFFSIYSHFSASALGVTSAQTVTYSRGHLRVDNGSGGMVTKNLEVPNPSMGAVLQHFNTSAHLNGGNGSILGWTLETNEVVPANSLISFYVQYEWYVSSWSQTTPPLVPYYGVQFANDKTLVSENCIGNSGQTQTQSVGTHTLSCTYLVYNSTPMQVFDTLPKQRIIAFTLASNFDNSIRFSNASYIQLTNDGLSASDRAWLESVLPDSTTVGEVEQAIDNARESEKQEYEDQAQETEDIANDESSAAQGTATTLLSVVGQFIGVLTSAQPTNCNLNGNLVPHLPLGQLNLCQNSPPAAITILGSLLLIAFVVPLAYHTVKRMLALIGSFQS